MADVFEMVKEHLKLFNRITDVVGANNDARIYLEHPKQGVQLPYIVIYVFEGNAYEHLSGITGTATNRVQVDSYGATSIAANTLAENVRLAPLQMYRGNMNGVFVNNVSSQGSYRTGTDSPPVGGNQKRYWVSRDYFVTYQEAITA